MPGRVGQSTTPNNARFDINLRKRRGGVMDTKGLWSGFGFYNRKGDTQLIKGRLCPFHKFPFNVLSLMHRSWSIKRSLTGFLERPIPLNRGSMLQVAGVWISHGPNKVNSRLRLNSRPSFFENSHQLLIIWVEIGGCR